MNILLIKPPSSGRSLTPTLGEPLELEYLAAAVKDHNVNILDMRLEKNLEKKLDAFKPDVVGVTAYTCEAKRARDILKQVKTYHPNIHTLVGGHHATFLPGDFHRPYVNAIFMGFADRTFPEYIRILEEGGDVTVIPQIALVRDDRLVFTERKEFDLDLDALPLPARHLIRDYRKSYRDAMRRRTAFVLTSRGCPFRCTFCACWKLMRGKYATRKPESVVEEMVRMPGDVDLVCFADDNTLHNPSRALRFIDLLKKRRNTQKFTMYARADTIVRHPELIAGLKEVGLEYLTVGLESFRDDDLEGLSKQSSVALNNEAIHILHRLGVGLSAHFIVDPKYGREDFRLLSEYICRRGLFRPVFAVLTPLPGTSLYERTFEEFCIRDPDYFDFAHSILPTKLERRDFYREFAKLYRKSYSLRRYLKEWIKRLWHFLKNPGCLLDIHPDRLSLVQNILVNIFAYPMYWRLKHSYKSEPLVHPPSGGEPLDRRSSARELRKSR